MRLAGIVQVLPPRSISPHVAPLASPGADGGEYQESEAEFGCEASFEGVNGCENVRYILIREGPEMGLTAWAVGRG